MKQRAMRSLYTWEPVESYKKKQFCISTTIFWSLTIDRFRKELACVRCSVLAPGLWVAYRETEQPASGVADGCKKGKKAENDWQCGKIAPSCKYSPWWRTPSALALCMWANFVLHWDIHLCRFPGKSLKKKSCFSVCLCISWACRVTVFSHEPWKNIKAGGIPQDNHFQGETSLAFGPFHTELEHVPTRPSWLHTLRADDNSDDQ